MATRKRKSAAAGAQDSAGTPPPTGDGQVVGSGDLRGSAQMGTAVISGRTFTNKSVTYYDVDGVAIVEGDIAIGDVSTIQRQMEAARNVATADPGIAFGVGIPGAQFRWPNCQIPYEIDPALPNQQRVTDAIAHWEANTAIRFVLRTPANQAAFANYVRFTDAGGCWSLVGMQGGQQLISLGVNCQTGNAIHEIGHTVGLWHEQSREDRDLFVTIQWVNIQTNMTAQFNQRIVDGDDLGNYDYASIMHYPRDAFTKNGQDTIVPTNAAAVIGQRNGLSAGDIAAVAALYPNCAVIKQPFTEPNFLKQWRDSKLPQDNKNQRDTKALTDAKQFRDAKTIRDAKLIRDIRKPLLDPKPVLDPKGTLDPNPGLPGNLGRPPLVQPFNLATPHHADLGAAGASYDASGQMDSNLAALQQQMLELDAAIAEKLATATRAQAEIAPMQQSRDELAAYFDAAVGGSGT